VADVVRCVLASRNQDKVREIRQILSGDPRLQLLAPDDLAIPYAPEEEAIEGYETFRENAMAKALYFAERASLPAIADDSGLAVDALGGAPGVRSKRFSGRGDLSGIALDQSNNDLLLERLNGIPAERRGAHYACAAAVALPGRSLFATIGTCSGEITTAPRGSGGFGYDPLFFLPEFGRTFGEIPAEEKNRRSHRARAFRALAAHLYSFLHG
jgi:XTP/dITP diphosphohydrolase